VTEIIPSYGIKFIYLNIYIYIFIYSLSSINFTGGKKNSELIYENYSSNVLFSKLIFTYKFGLLL